MSVLETRLEIAEMSADHHRAMENFEREQKEAVGRVLRTVCGYLGVPIRTVGCPPDDAMIGGQWRVSDILATAERAGELTRELTNPE